MKKDNNIRAGRHCVFAMHVHLVFVTKYRKDVFTREILDDLRAIFASVEAELVEFEGEDDHVHLLVNYPPQVSVSRLVNSLKGVSSRLIRKKHDPSIRRKQWWRSYSRIAPIHPATAGTALICWQALPAALISPA